MIDTFVCKDEKSPKYLKAKEVAERYGFSQRHWYRMVERKDAPAPTRFGGLSRWRIEDLEEWEANDCQPLVTQDR